MFRCRPSLTIVLLLTLALQGILLGLPLKAFAQPNISLELSTPFGGQYVVGAWLPLRITLSNKGAATTVTLMGTPANDSAQFTRTIDLSANAEKSVWLYIFLAQPTSSVIVTVTANESILSRQEVPLLSRPVEQMRAVLGESPVAGDLFAAGRLQPNELPDHPLGWSNLSVLAFFELSNPLSPEQQSALLEWVYGGGHVIIGGGPSAVSLQSFLPPDLQAAQIVGVTTLDRQPLRERGGAEMTTPLIGVKLRPLGGAYAVGDPDSPPWVEYPFGRGRVTQLAFEPKALQDWEGQERFWSTLAQPILLFPTGIAQSSQITSRQIETLAPVLGQLPAVDTPTVTQGFIALTGYALFVISVVVGCWWWRRRIVPVRLLILITLISTSIGLWWATTNAAPAYTALRLTLIEPINQKQARAQTTLTMLSAMPRREVLSFTHPVVTRPLPINISSTDESGPFPQATKNVALTLTPWIMQGILATMELPAPQVQATLVIDQERLRVDVQNDSPYTLQHVFVSYADQMIFFGNLRPGVRSTARWPVIFASSAHAETLGTRIVNDLRENGLLIGRDIERRTTILTTFIDAAIATLPDQFDPGPFLVAWLNQDPTVSASEFIGQRETLLVMRLRIIGQGRLILPMGWLRIDPLSQHTPACLNGKGVQLRGSTAEIRLRLPADLASFQADTIQVQLKTTNQLTGRDLVVSIYNWQETKWDRITFTEPSNFSIPAAINYLRNGELRLRFSGTLDQIGCIVVVGGAQGIVP